MSSAPENLPSPPLLSGGTPAGERIRSRLEFLYGADSAADLAGRVARILETHRQLRGHCTDGPYWTHRDIVLITYGDSIQSPGATPLQTLRTFLSRHLAQEFSMVHLLPFFPWSSDGGFSVTDFRAVNAELGDWEDIAALQQRFDLAIDLVLNHSSREHPWFVESRSSRDNPKRDWYWWRPPRPGTTGGEPGAEPTNWESFFSGPTWTYWRSAAARGSASPISSNA